MTHRYHPDADDPEDAILYDDCGRCDQQAEFLLNLDATKMRRLWDRTVAFERDDEGGYMTANERLAGKRLWWMMMTAQQRFGIQIARFDEWGENVRETE